MDKEAYHKAALGLNTQACEVDSGIKGQAGKPYNQIEQLEMENSKLKMEITGLKSELLNLYRARFNY